MIRRTITSDLPRLCRTLPTFKHFHKLNVTSIRTNISQTSIAEWDRGGLTDSNSLSPLYSSMRQLMNKHSGAVCFIQVGSFYELYFEHAEIYGPKLGLKVTKRQSKRQSIPMAGFPVFQLQKFVKLLVQDFGSSVAIIDQYPHHDIVSDKIMHRKISRIVTPGTLVDETFLNFNSNNYLCGISLNPNCTNQPYDLDTPVGLSWIDLSVGDFYVQHTTLAELMSDIARINPSEIIISNEFSNDNLPSGDWFPQFKELRKYFIRYHNTVYNDLKLLFKVNLNQVRRKIQQFSQREEAAMNMILSYIHINLPDKNPSLDIPIQYWNGKYLLMDSRTREALELTERSSGGNTSVVGSLLNTIKRTVTASGTRLLTEWIKSPVLDISELQYRQLFVTLFISNPYLHLGILHQLKELGDFVRSVQRLALGTGDSVTHLKSIADGILQADNLRLLLQQESDNNQDVHRVFKRFLNQLEIPTPLAYQIKHTIDDSNEEPLTLDLQSDDQPNEETYKFIIRKDYSSELLSYHKSLNDLRLKESSIIDDHITLIHEIDPKLTLVKKSQHVKFTDILFITGKQKLIETLYNLLDHNDVKDKRKTSLLYKPYHWTNLQHDITEVITKITQYEQVVINELKQSTIETIISIRKMGKLMDFLDITASFATLSKEYNMVCPIFTNSNDLIVNDGRHIVVESGLKNVGDNFTPNDVDIDNNNKLWVVSGPNMGGKSTFLRQNAVIVILAQIGCFIPASYGKIGVVDKIFTRIGASDDLFSDLSTFMVEMIEVSNILKSATDKSLAIVDEVGRGTSGKEGLAVAYSTLISLLTVNECRTLFATHFGQELYNLLNQDEVNQTKILYYRTRVIQTQEKGFNLVIDHKLEPGISERSYALEVAMLAGFPENSVKLANHALKLLS